MNLLWGGMLLTGMIFGMASGRSGLLSEAVLSSAREAVETYRAELGVIDQDLPPFVIAKDGQPVGKVQDGDSLILFNFRGDRALEISMAFDDVDFPYFDRGVVPQVKYAGMLQYDGDLCTWNFTIPEGSTATVTLPVEGATPQIYSSGNHTITF